MSPDDQVADAIRTILVPTDGSDAAGTALERALQLAELSGATVHVLSVVDTTTNPMQFGVTEVAELDRLTEELVDEVVATHDGRAVDVRGAIRRGRPAEVILSYTEENAIDMIVVGRTGSGGLAEALLGSTADRLVRQSTVPVVVVPEDGPTDDEN
jgi:nucleotide-binding universal stress UspA family protein